VKARLYTDGGARGNPGPAAAAFVLEAEDGTRLDARGEAIGVATNNVAEYRALLAGLERAAELGVTELEVVSDSELLVRQMSGEYRVKNEALKELSQRAERLARRVGRVTYRAVRREENELADRLVNEALDGKAGGGTRAEATVALDHAVIAVSDWERSNPFYRDVLGAELVDRGGAWAYRFGRQQLNVHGPGSEPYPVARDPVRPGNSDLCFVWPARIESAVEHLRAHDVEVEEGPVAREGARGAGRSVYFRDPDGSLLELISYER
jgi:ribonuclease HI/catechol 2,3-dioxygenase-like lactoylglutathione lyase family enzyme